jgi:hypothetical protein
VNTKILLTTIVSLVLIIVLSACGGSSAESSSSEGSIESSAVSGSGGEASSPRIGEDFQNALPISAQLGFGTLMLEDSEYAVSPEQAAELLPLWKAARSLSQSETVADAEMEAIFNQIEETMTSEQIAYISDLQLNGDEMAKLMQDYGIEFGFGGQGFGNLTPEQQATAQAARESGEGMPGGGFFGGNPGGGPGPGGGQGPGGGPGFGPGDISPEMQATLEARRAERGGSFGARFSLIFVDPLIELLEERATE